jgi:hypothetical protein
MVRGGHQLKGGVFRRAGGTLFASLDRVRPSNGRENGHALDTGSGAGARRTQSAAKGLTS